ncbi:MAG: Lrp/AsnC family transcriptional regulator [Candidatus Bathyarchaeota archaeon]|nr:MAG: Lrp/AsnC family transcriptional regulator [Candidatus Bathyarchaeota archaeon]
MTEKDETILRVLERKSNLTSRAFSRLIGIPASTLHRRIKRMEKEGTIKGYKAIIDYEKTSRTIGVVILISIAEVILERGHVPKEDIIANLKKFDAIEEIDEVQAANFDLVLKARLSSLRALSDFVEQLRFIEGIEEISTAIITNETILPPSPMCAVR